MIALIQQNSTEIEISTVDRDTFRLWLDCLLKVDNVANRSQVSFYREVPSINPVDTKTGVFNRLIYNAKIGKSGRIPTTIPTSPFLSFFIGAYLLYFTPTNAKFIFENTNGKPCDLEGERYIKQLRKYSVVPEWLFVKQHGIRRNAINVQCAFYHFDLEKIEQVAYLLRHTLNIMLTDYVYWYELHVKRSLYQNQEVLTYHTSTPEDMSKLTSELRLAVETGIHTKHTYDSSNRLYSELYKSLKRLFTVALSGTPLQNNAYLEALSLLKILQAPLARMVRLVDVFNEFMFRRVPHKEALSLPTVRYKVIGFEHLNQQRTLRDRRCTNEYAAIVKQRFLETLGVEGKDFLHNVDTATLPKFQWVQNQLH